ncbi:hypothetical protein J1N35_012001 [Gossypium stocksii]|uniref:Endonuclease/exonuclease/phosphatase domain-containing protein n=1 Tax=Gossypium stocksii TaxID=47602 RepID=A0A9D3W4J3_9ROSI|nr:hypothetical protein J1N35_012001 [Gossypium stocksii]
MGFYGHLEEINRLLSRELLQGLSKGDHTPWLVMGNFNEIFFSHEKQRGRLRDEHCMEAFRIVWKVVHLGVWLICATLIFEKGWTTVWLIRGGVNYFRMQKSRIGFTQFWIIVHCF